jgi:hypothetical protein
MAIRNAVKTILCGQNVQLTCGQNFLAVKRGQKPKNDGQNNVQKQQSTLHQIEISI